ncbi:MAG: DUF465 domain-containing protein [Thermoplasmatales archaeon]
MDMTTIDAIKEALLKENQDFRDLVQKHQSYEKRLSEIASLTYPSEEELLEESILKKKKLAVKDEIYEMISKYAASN